MFSTSRMDEDGGRGGERRKNEEEEEEEGRKKEDGDGDWSAGGGRERENVPLSVRWIGERRNFSSGRRRLVEPVVVN